MKAMILAAGLGTRLRPLTDSRPKALVELEGRTLLEMALSRLSAFGIRDVIVNVHHFADQVIEYLRVHENFGMRIKVSREEELLDTGGGLKKAAWFFLEDEDRSQPFLLHNVDVLSDIDLGSMLRFHAEQRALATLAVQARRSSRYLLFDSGGELCGRRFEREPLIELARPADSVTALAFSGIHVISPRFLEMMREERAFSIIETYLRLAGEGEKVVAFPADQCYWRDLGTPESLSDAADDLKRGLVSQGAPRIDRG